MIRIFLVLVAVLVAVFAFVYHQPWLYVAAGVPLVGALGLLGRQLWTAYQEQQAEARTSSPEDPSLEELGIIDVRPEDREGGNNGSGASKGAKKSSPPSAEDIGQEEATAGSSSEAAPAARAEAETETATRPTAETTATENAEHPVLGPFLESLRASIGAETACLLVQEEVVLEYDIQALASVHPDVQQSGTFETQSPLLTATMSRQSVTVRQLGEGDREELGYYESPPSLDQVAVAPVPKPDSPTTVFLLVDAGSDVNMGTSRVRSLLERFADTIGLLRDDDGASQGTKDRLHPAAEEEEGTTVSEAETERAEQPRPRSEIIAEEMKAADAGDDDLALVLVHLNRAESIARQGEEAVATAERLMRTRLKHFAPGQRVERFGELTYGLFPRHDLDAVETWAADLQDAMAQETGELEGGVSVGVAVRGPRHDAEALRADATEALREAYETGACTIVT